MDRLKYLKNQAEPIVAAKSGEMMDKAADSMDWLIGEVERLRAENKRLTSTARADVISDRDLAEDLARKVASLEAKNADLSERVAAMKSDQTLAAGETQALRAENTDLRKQLAQHDGFASDATDDVDYWRKKARDHWDACQGAIADAGVLKTKLAWFQRREPSVRAMLDGDEESDDETLWKLIEWEAANPKP